MASAVVQAPVSLLMDPALTPAAKVLWLAMHVSPSPTSSTRLAAGAGLVLNTVRTALSQLEGAGWYVPPGMPVDPAPTGAWVLIPTDLLPQRRVRPRAKVLYGILQTLPGFSQAAGQFTYRALSAHVGVSIPTARQSVQELARSGWIQASQENQLTPIRFTLHIPEMDQSSADVAQVQLRLEEADFRGEAIMHEYLSLLIDSDEFEENARPGFLVNPQTGERMELDRYYPPSVAFEFNGSQHYRTTRRYPSRHRLSNQQARDLMKEALCARREIRLIIVTPADLNLETLRAKVGKSLPLRDLGPHQELVRFLEKVRRSYFT